MHPSLRGQIALAQSVLQALQARRAFGWPKEAPTTVIDPAECVAHFKLNSGVWRAICLWGINFNNIVAPLTYNPSRRLEARLASAVAAERVAAGAALSRSACQISELPPRFPRSRSPWCRESVGVPSVIDAKLLAVPSRTGREAPRPA